MFIFLFLASLSVRSTLAAYTAFAPGGTGLVYIQGPAPDPTSSSGGTNGGIGTTTLSGLNLTSALSIASVSSLFAGSGNTSKISGLGVSSTLSAASVSDLSATSRSASGNSGPSVSSTFSTASVPGLSSGSSNLGSSVSSAFNNVAGTTTPTLSTSVPSRLGLTSAPSTPSITGTPATSSSVWPASITYVAQSGNSDVVGVAFTTTVNGTSKITTTQPQQSLITPTGSGTVYSLIAITEGGTTTTLTLSTLPTATLPSEPIGVQVVTESGIPVIYSPITLSGYSNTEPVEISTNFVETIDGQTTTQGGWWLIGIGGRIDPPKGRPWKTGSGIGCLAGPLICRSSCVDIGLFEICPPHEGGSGGGDETGPPGYPGGPIDGGGEPDDEPPPYEQPSVDDEPEKSSTNPTSTITASTSTNSTSISSGSAAQYYLVATAGADVAGINAFLEQIAPNANGPYAPLYPSNAVDGGFWTANLSFGAAASASSRSDISIVSTYTNTAAPSTWTPSALSDTVTVDLETLYASTLSPTETASAAKVRRRIADEGSRSDSGLLYRGEARKGSSEARVKNKSRKKESHQILKRDAGIRTVRQVLSPKDLSVVSWAPGVPSTRNVDYIFSERKGENTWVYVLDTGINPQHVEFRSNWPGRYGKFNIDPQVLRDPTVDFSNYPTNYAEHGTCMASKVCGTKTGVAKQATVIDVVYGQSAESLISVLELILINIRSRQAIGQALPGKTVLTISQKIEPYDASLSDKDNWWRIYPNEVNMVQQYLRAIMNLGVICVCAAGNDAQKYGFPRSGYPAALTSATFPLIPVGAVDTTAQDQVTVASFSQEGVIYMPGVNSPCASYEEDNFSQFDADGTSGGEPLQMRLKPPLSTRRLTWPDVSLRAATAMFAGLVALTMSEPGNVYGFGSDPTQYQQLVYNYYTVGYNFRRPALHPPGSWYRPGGSYAPVAWNGLDGSQGNVCPLTWPPRGAPGAPIKKRQTSDPLASPDICAAYTPHSVIIYSRAEQSCLDNIKNICPWTYFLYSIPDDPTGTPSDICDGSGFVGSVKESLPSNSIPFTLPTTTGETAGEDLKFVYSWTNDEPAGWVTGGSLTAPVACWEEAFNSSLTQTCTLEEPDTVSKRKRTVFPDGGGLSLHPVNYVYESWARCYWASD